jgi:amino acid adenylation domain-containing protein
MSTIHETYALSPVQKGILFHSLEQPSNGVYLQQFICNLNENINIEAFEQAWQKVIERHAVLRTGFQWQDLDEPQQIVYEQVNCPLHFEDWSDIYDPEIQLAAYLESDKTQGFDLSDAPLIRLTLFKFNDNDYRFIWTHHHIILDGRSYFILFKELFNIYKTFNENKELELGKVYPYSEYIEWLEQQNFFKSEPFWRKSLSGVEAPTPLIKNVEYVVEEEAYLEKTYDFSETLTEGLKFFAEENGLTLNTLVQAAWAILLSRYSGEDKVIFGATRACRHWTKIEPNNRVGIFINTLPFCTQLDANMDVLTWLNSLRSHWVDMREHEHTPLTQIQQWSDIRGDSPLFDSIVVFENADLNSTLRAQGGDWEKRNFTLLQTTNYPLLLAATVDSCLHLMLEYETARFDSGIINRMFGHLQAILINIIANPTQNLSEISLLTKLEKDQLLIEWNNTATDYPLDKCVHQLFEEQVEKTPDAIAVKFEDQHLTYRELNERANQVAHHLDVKPDTLIGLSVERSLEMIVGMLGILKAGAAYVPLDPSYPEERLNFILEDSGIEILLDKERLEKIDEPNIENPSTDVKPNNLAYVIYTSGSTGKPKGVLIEHQSLVNHNFAIIDQYNLTSEDKLLQFASFNFDVATEEIFPTLLAGASLVLWKPETANVISDFVEQQQLTVLNLPAQYWHTWVLDFTEKNQTLPACLRLVVAGSETVPIETVRLWHNTSDIELRNAYGPTESTITATTYKTELLSDEANSVPIGSSIANTKIYILDKNQELVPIGVPGELHIGGVGLARGYLNRPELTAEKFISLFNQRLYKTGDLVRYLPDGNIEFLGRIDNQVKIRGFRIELGEIESVIMKHVSEAAVIVREDQPGNKRLVAYTVGSTEDLRNLVKEELPHYMVPSAFVSLEKMPLTPNGKIDRRALPVPDQTEFEANFVAPRNSVEEKIAEIWKEILALKQVGIHDNFFELGGHSLLATQIVSRLSVTLQNLFENPTVAELAEIINSETKETVIIPRSDQHDVVSFAQQRLWFINQLEPNTDLYNIPAAFKINGNLNIARLQKSLNTIVERHEIIRTILKKVDGKPVPVVLDNVSVDLPVIKLNDEAEIQNLINEEAARTFDISTDLMLRATLLEVNSNEFVLILMHHIASDGWSFGILFDEFVALYQGNTLPELAIQYSDFAVWQRQYLSDQVLETQLSYWKQQLEGMPTTLELPIDRQRPATQTTNGKTLEFLLPASIGKALKTLSQQQGVTLFMTLLGAFKILLHRYTNQDDIVVGSPIAGRNQSELEDLIGFFVNTLVLRSKINKDSNFIEFLGHVREVALGAYAHQDVPFDKLVSELKFERDVSRHPLFQVMFDLQNANQQDLQLPDLSIKPLLADNDTAKFDLILDIEEQTNSELKASFNYNTDLFDDSTIERMMVHFQTVLESIVANPKQSISELEILDKAETDQLLIEWNNTAADYPLDKCVHQLFEEQVEKTPDAIAVKFEDQQLTYSELNARANQVAHHLDVKPDTLVGLSVNVLLK